MLLHKVVPAGCQRGAEDTEEQETREQDRRGQEHDSALVCRQKIAMFLYSDRRKELAKVHLSKTRYMTWETRGWDSRLYIYHMAEGERSHAR